MSLQVQVVSPERVLWTGEAAMVTARTVEGGDITFLSGHVPFVGALEVGKVTVRPAEGSDIFFAVHGGFVEVSTNEVTLLTDVAEAADQVDIDRATASRAAAKATLAHNASDGEALAALRRAELRLEIAGVVPA
ncbi:MAG: ATP synthase F1 subunit epsilon [Aquihabitans sp.]